MTWAARSELSLVFSRGELKREDAKTRRTDAKRFRFFKYLPVYDGVRGRVFK